MGATSPQAKACSVKATLSSTTSNDELAFESRQGSLSSYVYEQLRKQIHDRKLKSGERLREVDIAANLNVSRTPVREALKRLEAEGLVRFAPPRGFVVEQLSPGQVMQLYAMLKVLMGAAARFAAEQASPIELQSIQQILAQLERAKKPNDVARINKKLHEAIVTAAHNEYLLKAVNVLNDARALLGTTTYSIPGRIERGLEENRQIVAHIAKHDPDGAEKAAHTHIGTAISLRLQLLFGSDSEKKE
jgi:DNA-binding GntR family transcriptional regulator